MIGIKKLVFCFFLLLLSATVFSQNEDEVSLRSVLEILENRFNVTFSYLDENIERIFLPVPPEHLGLDEILQLLTSQSGLEYKRLNIRNITISKPGSLLHDLCGYIKDSESKEPLIGATIQYGDKFSVSDENGYFKLQEIPVVTVLLIRFIGYQAKRITASELDKEKCSLIFLDTNPTILSEIIVPDYLMMGINKRVDGSFTLYTQNLGILPGLTEPDLIHSLQTLPGIQSINETVSDINVRGGTNDQNLVLWEGIRMYQSGHFFGLISVYNPYLTKEVDLIKNGTSVLYGDGVSSTIKIQMDDEIGEIVSGGAGINMLYTDAFLKIPLSSKIAFNVAGRRSIGDLAQTPTYTKYFDRVFRDTDVFNSSIGADSLATSNQAFKFYDVSANFIYDISSKDKLRINFLNILNEINFQENALINNITESKTSSLSQKTLAGNLSFSRLWNPKFRTSALFYVSKYNLNSLNVNLFENQRLIQENEVLDIGLKVDSRITIINALDLFFGYQLSEVGITNLDDINNPDFRRLIKNVLITHAGFTEVNFNSQNGSTNLRTGLRVSYLDKFGKWLVEPRLAFNQKFLKNFSLEILGEMKSQSTTQIIDFQTDFLGVEKRRWVLSNNDDITIVKSKQTSVGLQYSMNNVLVSLEGFIKMVNGINSLSQGFQNQFQFIKATGSYDTYGIDFLISKKMGLFDSWISYSFSDNSYNFPDFVPPSFPSNLDITHNVSIGIAYISSKWEISTGINWHTGKPFTQPSETEPVIDNEINYQFPNSSRIADYLRLDFSAIYNFQIGNQVSSQAGFSLWNIFNRENIINSFYILDNNNQIQLIEQNALALTPNLMLRINF